MINISRRGFIKCGVLGGSWLISHHLLNSLAPGMELDRGGKEVARTTGKVRKAIPSTCMQCSSGCGILAFVSDGVVVKIEGNPNHPNNRGRLCAKGQAGINHLYSPDRLLFPLRRVGQRGEGKWKRISWEEATREIVTRLNYLKQEGRENEFFFQASMRAKPNANLDIVRRFLHAYGTSSVFLNTALGGAIRELALELTWGSDFHLDDVAHAKYILNFGGNPYEAHSFHNPIIQRIVDARMNGAKLVTFDVRLSNTAGRSDEWHPVKSGTDAIVALAMANVILEEGLEDREFLLNWTNYPLEQLKEHLSAYTPEKAEKVSGLRAEDIRRLALEFATVKPATTITGRGLSMHINGLYNERCVALLNAIAGTVDRRGGYCLPRNYGFQQPEPIPEKPEFLSHYNGNGIFETLRENRHKVKFYMAYMTNPVFTHPESSKIAEILQDRRVIPFFVAVDTYLSETAALADMVLPDTTYLEMWDLESKPSFSMVPFIGLRQPVVKALGESYPFAQYCIDLAGKIRGMEGFFPFTTVESYLETVIAKTPSLARQGGLGYLMKNGVWYDHTAKPEYESYRKAGFNTPSGKFEIYSHRMKEKGLNPLPVYEALPSEAAGHNGQMVLTNFKVNVHSGSRTSNCKWLTEIVHNSELWINAETARNFGIRDGDEVEIKTALGIRSHRIRLSQGLHPHIIAYLSGLGHWEFGKMAQGKKSVSRDIDTKLIWWEKHENGLDLNPIIPVSYEAVTSEQAWMDTLVSLNKVRAV